MYLILGTLLSLMSFNVVAQNIHYFGSIKGSQTTIEDNDAPFDAIYNKITIAPLSTAGFSFDANLNDKYQALAQFIYVNNSTITVDLLQLRYHFTSDFVVRVGRQRLPTYLHSENIQVQALLPWMTAPREVYGRVPIYSFTGASLEKALGDNLVFHFYAGDTKDKFVNGDVDYDIAASNLYGGRVNLKLHQFNAFVNAYRGEAKLHVKTDIDAAVNGGSTEPGTTVGLNQNYKLENITGITSGFQYRPKEFFLMSEYYVITSDSPAIARVEGAYVSIGKEISEKWIPVATFSTDLDVESELSPSKTATYMFNLNYRLDYNNIIKIGVEHINYKERTVSTSNFPGTTSASIFTNTSPGENFEIYSLLWAFVY